MFEVFRSVTAVTLVSLFAAAPSSTSFTLKSYDFGNGGGAASSSSYNLDGTTGVQSGQQQSSASFGIKPGEIPTQDANVPPAATLSNPNSFYNKLHLVINNGSNPTDTKFAIAISSDNFVTTRYVQNDNSIGPVLGIEDHQTYAVWGSATGFDILGLLPGTTYKVRVSALQGKFSGSAFGPASTGLATAQPSISFSVATSLSATPPFGVSFTSLTPNTVYSSNADAVVTLSSNAVFGGAVYVKDSRSGLFSTSNSYTLPSASADLTAATSGYGAQVTSSGQTGGGPFVSQSPYNGLSNNVGLLDTSMRQVLTSAGPIVTGTSNITLKAKAATLTPAAVDYNDTLTFIAAMLF